MLKIQLHLLGILLSILELRASIIIKPPRTLIVYYAYKPHFYVMYTTYCIIFNYVQWVLDIIKYNSTFSVPTEWALSMDIS